MEVLSQIVRHDESTRPAVSVVKGVNVLEEIVEGSEAD